MKCTVHQDCSDSILVPFPCCALFLGVGQCTSGQVFHCLYPLSSANRRRGCQTMTKERSVRRLEKRYITNQRRRAIYIYTSENQPPVTIIPGENGVTEVDIKVNHEMDDEEIRAWNRYIEKTNHYIDDFVGDSQAEHNKVLADWDADPINEIVKTEDSQKKQELIEQLDDAMEHLTEKQLRTIQMKFFENRTNVDIAAEEGVSEAAIRNRLSKVYRRLGKLIKKGF